MKNKLLLLFAALLLSGSGIQAQSVAYINANNIKSGYMPGGILFALDSNTYDSYEVPIGSGIKSIYASSFWISGLVTGGNLVEASTEYDSRAAFSYGPVGNSYNLHYDSVYNKVFKITRSEILYHRLHYTDPGYVASADIAQWPGNGNVSNGEAAVLAPFIDLNHNGVYEPALGDYPDVCGDQAVFMIMNDSRPGVNTCRQMGVELHVLVYAIAAGASDPLNNTTFVNVKVFNRSSVDYHNVYFSNFVDNDLGCPNNDRIGCDTTDNYFYVYNGVVNGNSADAGIACPSGQIGYGNTKVAQATVFLNHKMTSFEDFTNGAPYDQADPSTCQQYRNYQTGYWRDGTPLTYGGSGIGGSIVTPFVYPGDPSDTSQWSEINPHSSNTILPGDRRGVGSIRIDSLAAGQSVSIDLAYVTSFADSNAANLSELVQLRQDVGAIHTLYNQGLACRSSITGVNTITDDHNQITVYPNPAHNLLIVESTDKLASVTISDLEGRELLHKNVENDSRVSIDISSITHGVYLLIVKDSSGRISTQKILVD